MIQPSLDKELLSTIDRLNAMRGKGFGTTKEAVSWVKTKDTEWENNFTSYISDRGVISRICKEHKQHRNLEITLSENVSGTRRESSQKKKNAKIFWKNYPSFLATREMQIRTILIFHLSPSQIKKWTNQLKINDGDDIGEKKL